MTEESKEYPTSAQFRVLEGYDIYRSNRLIIALVAVEGRYGRDLRLYRWQKRGENWRVDLCRMSVAAWQWDKITAEAKRLAEQYGVRR